MIRVTALAPYPASGPSTRFRLAQFQEPLRARGIELRIVPFVGETAFGNLYGRSTRTRVGIMLRGLRDRVRALNISTDAWIVHREVAPLFSVTLLAELVRRGTPYIYDFDDAVYLPAPGGHPVVQGLRRPLATTSALVREADLVLAGNDALAAFARDRRRRGSIEAVQVLPTVIDTHRFQPRFGMEGNDRTPVVGWIGTHTTARYLQDVLPGLARLRERTAFRFRVISNQPPPWARWGHLEVEYVPWSADEEVAQTQGLAVGLYPLQDTPWERGKCGFKAIQYLACGVPVVASAVGVVPHIVRHEATGLLVPPGSSWEVPVERLLTEAGIRKAWGADGRADIEHRFSVEAVMPILERSIRAIAPGRG